MLQFKQSPWLKPYIDFNTKQRALATSNFEKQFFKLMNNAVYGKTQKMFRKRINVELITNEKILKKRVANPGFKHGRRVASIYQGAVGFFQKGHPPSSVENIFLLNC